MKVIMEEREAEIRRRLGLLGYRLMKSRSQATDDPAFGLYGIVHAERGNYVVEDVIPVVFSMTLADVEAWLEQREA